ncbi:hypothetical protein LINPERPRIM_LOCUS20345 [Linum perenne]
MAATSREIGFGEDENWFGAEENWFGASVWRRR